ncbi:MAG: hypothetical protein ACPIA6_07900, partial [Poseidonia sp.]
PSTDRQTPSNGTKPSLEQGSRVGLGRMPTLTRSKSNEQAKRFGIQTILTMLMMAIMKRNGATA